MRHAAVLSLMLLCSGCAQEQRLPAPASQAAYEPGVQIAHQTATPVLLRYLPPERGGPTVFPQAQVHGVLDLTGPCVRLQGPDGRMTTVLSSSGVRLERGSAGPYIQTPTERLRHGSAVMGGGGWFDSFPALGTLDRPVPEACRSGPFVVVTGMTSHDAAH